MPNSFCWSFTKLWFFRLPMKGNFTATLWGCNQTFMTSLKGTDASLTSGHIVFFSIAESMDCPTKRKAVNIGLNTPPSGDK